MQLALLAAAASILGGWLIVATLAALALGRAIHIADTRPTS